MKNLLPKNWRWVKLGEVAKDFVNGGTPNTNIPEYWDGNIPWITGADVTNFWVSKGRKYITEGGLKNSATHLVPKDTVLIVTRTGVGKVAIATNDICFSQDITGIICSKEIHPEYLVRFILLQANNLTFIQRGATIKGLVRTDLENLAIPLPSLTEQKRIITEIQELMQEIEQAKESCEKQLEAANALPSAYLREVFESEEAKKWESKPVEDFFEKLRVPKQYEKHDVSEKGKISVIDQSPRGIYGYHNNKADFCASPDSPLITFANHTCHIRFIDFNFSVIQNVFPLKAKVDVDPRYFYYLIQNRIPQKEYKGHWPQFIKLVFPKPQLSLQQNIATGLKEKMQETENLQSKIQNQLETINALPQTILHKAFRGEL